MKVTGQCDSKARVEGDSMANVGTLLAHNPSTKDKTQLAWYLGRCGSVGKCWLFSGEQIPKDRWRRVNLYTFWTWCQFVHITDNQCHVNGLTNSTSRSSQTHCVTANGIITALVMKSILHCGYIEPKVFMFTDRPLLHCTHVNCRKLSGPRNKQVNDFLYMEPLKFQASRVCVSLNGWLSIQIKQVWMEKRWQHILLLGICCTCLSLTLGKIGCKMNKIRSLMYLLP
jgi:hypothetical protein